MPKIDRPDKGLVEKLRDPSYLGTSTAAARSLEDAELQVKTERALQIAVAALEVLNLKGNGCINDSDAVTLATAILKKMK